MAKIKYHQIKEEIRQKYPKLPWYLRPFLRGDCEQTVSHEDQTARTTFSQTFVTTRYKGKEYLVKFGKLYED